MPPKSEAPKKDPVVEVGFVILVLIFIWVIWSAFYRYYISSKYGSLAEIWRRFLAWFLESAYPIIIVLSAVVSVLAIAGIIKNFKKLSALEKEEQEIFGQVKVFGDNKIPDMVKNERWEHIKANLDSSNPSDWRQAIIEADIMLDEMLRVEGYTGESVGELLKGVDKSDMLTLDAAWEAHKIRNEIVHSGSDYLLNERDAKRALSLYESVFKEFEII